MSPDDPRHGTTAGAQQHWKDHETPCMACMRAYKRSRVARTRARGPLVVPLGDEAWRIVDRYTPTALAEASGLPRNKFTDWRAAGPRTRVHRTTRARILRVQPMPTVIGIQRRLQALAVLGIPTIEIAEEIGCARVTLDRLRRHQDPKFVCRDVRSAVIDYYAEHETDPVRGPGRSASQTQRLARNRRWAPPLAWDDIDDPRERPHGHKESKHHGTLLVDEMAIQRVMDGERVPCNQAERREAIRRWSADGRSLNDLERLQGWNARRDRKGAA